MCTALLEMFTKINDVFNYNTKNSEMQFHINFACENNGKLFIGHSWRFAVEQIFKA